jgi:hypothetical protein
MRDRVDTHVEPVAGLPGVLRMILSLGPACYLML